ncbi:hypothetical protein [Oryzihumus leptocrescens]|uniref:Heparin binding hemagglutinin HbhA n=1 Tax=Oryzihumus leptocrescens TaxID=297536 RepID=A0A542ZN80_9MICO|nr:hypothetical protein [Oryzihumus leptocrescens]TQL61821.1 hypothetical protein FB474_3241 [Oryzihumus leptocrescens]
MALVADLRKTVTDTTPVYAVVGATDLAVEKVREARTRAAALRAELGDFDVTAVQGKAVETAQHVPALALNRTLEIAGKAQESYDTLAERGQKLVTRIRGQKATQDLLAQAGNTLALGKGAVTTIRNAATDTERAVKATLTTGRREATEAAETVKTSAKTTGTTTKTAAKKATKATKPAAKRATTTATKRAATAKSATKAAATSAAKTAEAAEKAVEAAAEKVGD